MALLVGKVAELAASSSLILGTIGDEANGTRLDLGKYARWVVVPAYTGDDADAIMRREEAVNVAYSSYDTWAYVGEFGGVYSAAGWAVRFDTVGFALKGATILSAHFTPKQRAVNVPPSDDQTMRSRLRGLLDGSPFDGTVSDYETRLLSATTAVVDWDAIPGVWPWIGVGETEEGVPIRWLRSPDISSVVQELVDAETWGDGDPLTISHDDFDQRTVIDDAPAHIRCDREFETCVDAYPPQLRLLIV